MIAGILDFFTVFFIGGYIIVYFVVGHRYAGGTIWQRLLKAR